MLKNKIWQLILSLIFGVVAAILSHYGKVNSAEMIIISIFTTFSVFLILSVFLEIPNKLREIKDSLKELCSEIGRRGEDLSEVFNILKYGFCFFERPYVHIMWENLLWSIRKRLWATSYIAPEEWENTYSQLGEEIQKAKIKAGNVEIKRVFIVDDVNELNKLKPTMMQQENLGIKVRYIMKNKLNTNSVLCSLLPKLHSLDFGIIDEKLIGIIKLDKKTREIKGGVVQIFSETNSSDYVRFYETLFRIADEPP